MLPFRILLAAFGALLLASCAQEDARGPVVLAAASLTDAMEEVADEWAALGHPRPVLSFAGTSSLARQAEGGAPADIFIAADAEWMDWLAERNLVDTTSRVNLLGNGLVLVGERDGRHELWLPPQPIDRVIAGERIAVADTDAVPAGRYAKAALTALGEWEMLQPQLVPAENVRAALALVERGEVPFGIVYASDQAASRRVALLGSFPTSSHPPIVYPAALLSSSDNDDAGAFLTFLQSPQAQRIFSHYGFRPPPQ